MQIKDRVFGADIAPKIKKKLRRRQSLNKSADFGESTQMTDWESYASDFKENDKAVADLSSRTPFVRMWVALQTYTLGQLAECKMDEDPAGEGKPECIDDDTHAIFSTGESYWQREVNKSGKPPQIYQIGNHVLNMLETDINEPIAPMDADGTLRKELASNPFLKPQSGILSLSSETKSASSGPLGVLKETTINFVVHNFQDFEKIYRPYFLRPGALVFVDYGWSTSKLYNPKNLKFYEEDVENKLMEHVAESAGDLDIIIGHVLTYDAKVKENGSIECSVQLLSQNTALIEQKLTTPLMKKINTLATEFGGTYQLKDDADWKGQSGYISWGRFEDKVLNSLFGFAKPSDDTDQLLNGPKFNSSGSYMRYIPNLPASTRGDSGDPVFLYPETWATKDIDTGDSVKHARIPMRELLINYNKVVHCNVEGDAEGNATAVGNTVNNYIDEVLNKINSTNDGLIILEKYSNSYAYSTISICDSNYLRDIDQGVDTLNAAGATSSDFQNFFIFKPGSPVSIVKTYDLSFAMPKGDLQNRIAIENSGDSRGFFPVHDKMDRLLADQQTNMNQVANDVKGLIKYLPEYSSAPESVTVGEDKTGELQRIKNVYFNRDTSPATLLNLTLSVYGISSLAPGDLFRVDFLPGYLLDNTFFRVMSVSHDITSSTWSTTLTTIQQFLYTAKRIPLSTLWKEDQDISDGKDNAPVGSEAGGITIATSIADLCARLMNIGMPCEDGDLNETMVKTYEISRKRKPSFNVANVLGHCKDRIDFPTFKTVLNKTEEFEEKGNLGRMGFTYIPILYEDFSSVGIMLLNEAAYDCDVEIYGKASKGCDINTGYAGEFACEYEGYGYSKQISMLWAEATRNAAAEGNEDIGEFIRAQSAADKSIVKIKKGQSYYLITNAMVAAKSQRNIIAPAQANFDPKDYDFNIGWERHIDTDGKCDYGWELNYQKDNESSCKTSYMWRQRWEEGSGEVPTEEIIDVDTSQMVKDYTYNGDIPQWAQFSKEWDDYFRGYYFDNRIGHGMPEWSNAQFDLYSYFIDCNPNSLCYLKAFAVDSPKGKVPLGESLMRIFRYKRGNVKPRTKDGSHFLNGGLFPGAISGVQNGIAVVSNEPYCEDHDAIKPDGVTAVTRPSTFLMDTHPLWFEENDEWFETFCSKFKKYGPNPPPLEKND